MLVKRMSVKNCANARLKILLAWAATVSVAVLVPTCVIYRQMSARDQLSSDLAKNERIWEDLAMHNYFCRLTMGCDSCSSPWGRFGLTVNADTLLVAVRDTTVPGLYDSSDMKPFIPTVPGLFQKISNALTMNVGGITVRFNSIMGYPESIWIDYDASQQHDDYTYGIDSIAALP
jgi:hypothetical protein